MSTDGGNDSVVSIVAILAILVLVGVVLYFAFVLPRGDDAELELDVNVDTIGQLEAPSRGPAVSLEALPALLTRPPG